MRDKLLLAEQDIAANKSAWAGVVKQIDEVKNELLAKIDSLSRAEGETKAAIAKWQPYLNAAAWVITGAAEILLSMLVSGKLSIAIH